MSESWSLDGLELNDGTLLRIVGEIDLTPPKSRAEWITAADSRFAALMRTNPLHENREIVLPLEVVPQGSIDPAFDAIGQVRDKLRAASASPDGIELTWSPDGSGRTMTFDVLEGQVTGLPINHEFDIADMPQPQVTLTCKPYGRGAEVMSGTFSGSIPVISGTVTAGGDVPALARLIVTDGASQTRGDVEWGVEGADTYDPATALILDSDSLVTSGFSGTGTTRSGAYDPNASGNSVIRQSTVSQQPSAICGTGNQGHVGTFRVWARCYVTSSSAYIRLAWRVGDSQYTRNTWAAVPSSVTAGWVELDLGTITVPPVLAGTQQWDGRVEVMSASGTATVDIDYLSLIPATDGYGRARATFTYQPGAIVGYDDFESLSAGTVLNGRSATTGGTWATSGATTDFVGNNFSTNKLVTRSTNADSGYRYAILGSTNYTNIEVAVGTNVSASPNTNTIDRMVIARWTDSSNFFALSYSNAGPGGGVPFAQLVTTVSGVGTQNRLVELPQFGWVTLRLIVYASGLAIGQLLNQSGGLIAQMQHYSSVLATGGALATGKPGFADHSGAGGSVVRYYDPFTAATPTGDPSVLFSGQNMEFRHDDVIRQDAGGTFYGRVPSYRGTRVYMPPGEGRFAVAARRQDRDLAGADNVVDPTSFVVATTPQYLVIPRA